MNKELYEFMRRIESRILETLPEGEWQINERSIPQNNGKAEAVCITREGSNREAVLYMEPPFEAYKNGESFENICARLDRTVAEVCRGFEAPEPMKGINEIFKEYGRNILMQLVETRKNTELLKEMPHREYMNLSVIYRIDIYSEGATVPVTNQIAEKFGLTEEELFERARGYVPKAYPLLVSSLSAVLETPMFFVGPDEMPMLLISYGKCSYGASVLMDPDALRQAADKIGGDIYILPASVHELIAVPYAGSNEKYLLDMVRMINRTELERKDVLSDCVYRYDREKGQLEVIGEEPERGADRDAGNEYTM